MALQAYALSIDSNVIYWKAASLKEFIIIVPIRLSWYFQIAALE